MTGVQTCALPICVALQFRLHLLEREFFAETADVDLCGFPLGHLARCCVVYGVGCFKVFSSLDFLFLQRVNGRLGGGDLFVDFVKGARRSLDVFLCFTNLAVALFKLLQRGFL